jgi:membrane fusion protein, hemolysin D
MLPQASLTNVVRLRSPPRRGAELEFLPAALEIIETPASPLGRATAATIALFFAVAIIWASVGRIDIIATASGKIVSSGRTKTIQPLEPGIVSAIHVADGDHVNAGQVLIELDATVAAADCKHTTQDLLTAQLDVARLQALWAGLDAGAEFLDFEPPSGASRREIERTQAAMMAQASEQTAKLASLGQQIEQKLAESDEVSATIAKLESSLPMVQKEADIRRQAVEIEFGNKIANLQAQEKLVEQQHELVVQQRRATEALAARRALERQREQTTAEYRHKILGDLSDAEQKAAGLAQDLVKASERLEERVLRAPVDGTVQQLALHTVGGVVTPAQQLMMVVPADSHVEVEAMVSNRDIGFVQPDQKAEIKIDTFNFTRYGLLHGRVVSVSQDAIVRDKPSDKSNAQKQSGALSESSEPQGQELLYAARVALDRAQMEVEGKLVNLGPGMAVTVEIKTGSRRVIEYLLSPLLRYRLESLRER